MAQFTGKLNTNAVVAALFNMIISEKVYSDPYADDADEDRLVDEARVDGSLYGDTKLYISLDATHSYPWGADEEASNLLALDRGPAPKVQALTMNVFRQVLVTLDAYLSKQAFTGETSFSDFNSERMSWLRRTKRIYDTTTYCSFIGTNVSTSKINSISVTLADGANYATDIGLAVANLFTQLTTGNRDYNENNFYRKLRTGELEIVWNADFVNRINYKDLPFPFHDEKLKAAFVGKTLAPQFFGTINTKAKVKADENTRSLIEQTIGNRKYFAGELIDKDTILVDSATAATKVLYPSYQVDSSIIAKVKAKRGVPYMSAFEVETSFFNARSLTENHYLTWGHNTLEHLAEYPLITIKKA